MLDLHIELSLLQLFLAFTSFDLICLQIPPDKVLGQQLIRDPFNQEPGPILLHYLQSHWVPSHYRIKNLLVDRHYIGFIFETHNSARSVFHIFLKELLIAKHVHVGENADYDVLRVLGAEVRRIFLERSFLVQPFQVKSCDFLLFWGLVLDVQMGFGVLSWFYQGL